MTMSEQVVFRAGEGPFRRIRPDLAGVLIGGEKVTLVRWDFPVGRAPTPVHAHAEHEQFCIMLAGSVRTRLGDEEVTLNAGDKGERRTFQRVDFVDRCLVPV